jgi:predicted transcriptional regulator
MTIQIPSEIVQAVEELAHRSGVPAQNLLLDALRAHFPPISLELQTEFDAWDRASNEDGGRIDQDLEKS